MVTLRFVLSNSFDFRQISTRKISLQYLSSCEAVLAGTYIVGSKFIMFALQCKSITRIVLIERQVFLCVELIYRSFSRYTLFNLITLRNIISGRFRSYWWVLEEVLYRFCFNIRIIPYEVYDRFTFYSLVLTEDNSENWSSNNYYCQSHFLFYFYFDIRCR
jgi:hypothetical protein